jgi:archaellum component FlaC
MTDRNLEEAIFQLQKLNAENGVKQLVEEAAQLFTDGRHIEASALLEKAEAIVASGAPAGDSSAPLSPAHGRKPGEQPTPEEQAMTNLAGRLAEGLARILTGAFQELELHVIGESRKVSASFEHELDRLRGAVDSLTQLDLRLSELSQAVSSQRSDTAALGHKYDHLSASVMSLEESSARREKEVGTLRGDTKDLSIAVSQQLDMLSARLGSHEDEVGRLKSTVSEIAHQMSGFIERVDRQGEVLRGITETSARRAAALDELLGVITRLRAPAESVIASAAGPL